MDHLPSALQKSQSIQNFSSKDSNDLRQMKKTFPVFFNTKSALFILYPFSKLENRRSKSIRNDFVSRDQNLCRYICSDPTKTFTKARDILLANSHNKFRFINQLVNELSRSRMNVKQIHGDPARMIVHVMFQSWQSTCDNINFSKNADIICIILSLNMDNNVLFNIPNKGWYSSLAIQFQYKKLAPCLIVLHCFTGCKVTSTLYRTHKKTIFKMFEKNFLMFIELFKLFLMPATNGTLSDLICTYAESLKTKRTKDFNLTSLPPTSTAAQYHILRCY